MLVGKTNGPRIKKLPQSGILIILQYALPERNVGALMEQQKP